MFTATITATFENVCFPAYETSSFVFKCVRKQYWSPLFVLYYKPLHATGSVVRGHFAWLNILTTELGFKQFVCLSTKGHRCWLLFYSHNLSLSTCIGAVWRKSISISSVLFRFKNTICARDTNYVLGPITKIQEKQPWQYNTTTLQNVIKRQIFETSNNKTLRVNSHVIEKTLFYLS